MPTDVAEAIDALRVDVIVRIADARCLVVDRQRVRSWVENSSDGEVWNRVELWNAGLIGQLRRMPLRARQQLARIRVWLRDR